MRVINQQIKVRFYNDRDLPFIYLSPYVDVIAKENSIALHNFFTEKTIELPLAEAEGLEIVSILTSGADETALQNLFESLLPQIDPTRLIKKLIAGLFVE